MTRLSSIRNFNIKRGLILFWMIVVWLIALLSSCSSGHSEILGKVDSAILSSEEAQNLALAEADSIATSADSATDISQKIDILLKSADSYSSLDLSKALNLIYKSHEVASQNNVGPNDTVKILLRLASLYNSQGSMTKEAHEIFESFEPQNLPPDLKLKYYILGVQVHKTMADRSFDSRLKKIYNNKVLSYRDSVLMLEPGNTFIAANKLIDEGRLSEALLLLKKNHPDEDSNERKGPYFHYLANIYRQLEMPDSQLFYLAKASEDDLNHGVRDYIALSELANLIQDDDLDRAYTYIHQSLKDNRFSNSTRRKREIVPIYDVINYKYLERQQEKVSSIIIVSIFLFVILLAIACAFWILRKKNKLLTLQSRKIASQKEELEVSNNKLKEYNEILTKEGHLKESFMGAFMQLCLSYLEKMESYRAKIGKLAATGDLDKVTKTINSSRYVNREIAEFYNSFDNAFLSLFPQFIQNLNSLLREDEKFSEWSGFNTELRIYALIWLGIESSGEIAKFLRCSESTVYNYRTMMRNKARNRSDFERDFIDLSTRTRHY